MAEIKTEDVQVDKDGRDIATVPVWDTKNVKLPPDPKWLGVEQIQCYYFPRIKLTNSVVWEVMAGTALSQYLDHCNLSIMKDSVRIEDLRYVHGRAEVMKGRPSISTVLLVRVRPQLPEAQWLSYLPAIYEEFLRVYGEVPKAT